MVQGLKKKFKQPVAHYFSGAQTSSSRLQVFIKEVIDACTKALLFAQFGTLKSLGVTENTPYFFAGGRRIYGIYDPPHLLKCTRNNFKKHGRVYYVDGEVEVNGKTHKVNCA